MIEMEQSERLRSLLVTAEDADTYWIAPKNPGQTGCARALSLLTCSAPNKLLAAVNSKQRSPWLERHSALGSRDSKCRQERRPSAWSAHGWHWRGGDDDDDVKHGRTVYDPSLPSARIRTRKSCLRPVRNNFCLDAFFRTLCVLTEIRHMLS